MPQSACYLKGDAEIMHLLLRFSTLHRLLQKAVVGANSLVAVKIALVA